MDHSKFLAFAKNGQFADVNLVLVDHNQTIKLSTYRAILASASDYYSKLFSNGKTEFTIQVENVSDTLNQILSYYDQNINASLYPDVKLILSDKNQNIEVSAHRFVLASASEYFLKLFTFGDNYQQSVFHIQVDNAEIAHDLMMSFYGQNMKSDWMHLLKTIKSKSFFCVDLDPKQLYGLKIPSEGFDLLLEVMNLFDYVNDRRLIATINRNIPKDYALSNFTEELVNELTEFRKPKMVSGSNDNTIKLWDVETAACLRTFKGHTDYISTVVLFADNTRIISGSMDKTIKLWDVETGECLRTFDGHTDRITSLVVFIDNCLSGMGQSDTKIISTSWDKTIKLWNLRTGECLRTFVAHTGKINSVVLFADGTRMVSASNDKTIKLWNIETGQCLHTFKGHDSLVSSTVLFEDDTKMISHSGDGTIKIWDIESGKCLQTFEGHIEWVTCLVLSTDHTRMVSGGYDEIMKLWNIKTGECLCTFQGHTDWICQIALFADNNRMISGSVDKTIKLWDMKTGECLCTFRGHTDSINSMILFANDTKIISGSNDKKIKLWDVKTGQCLRTFEGHTDYIVSLTLFTDN